MRPLRMAVLAACLAVTTPAIAALQEFEVLAEATGASPEEAKQAAAILAQKKAIYALLQRIDPDKAVSRARELRNEDLPLHIRGYRVLQDKAMGKDYVGRFAVTVNDAKLLAASVPVPAPVTTPAADRVTSTPEESASEAQKLSPILVLPVLRRNGQTMLWERENSWRTLWNALALERGRGALIVPYGDNTDMQAMDARNVLMLPYGALKPIAERYGVQDVVIAVANVTGAPEAAEIQVVLRHVTPTLDRARELPLTPLQSNEQTRLTAAAGETADALRQLARQDFHAKSLPSADAPRLRLVAPLTRSADWGMLRQKINAMPEVARVELESLALMEARLTLFPKKDNATLMTALQGAGFTLTPQGETYLLTRSTP